MGIWVRSGIFEKAATFGGHSRQSRSRKSSPIARGVTGWHSGLPLAWPLNGASARPDQAYARVPKRVVDVAGALIGLSILSPMLLCVALALKMEAGGPVLFRQFREGLDGKIFETLKFRTMRGESCDSSGIAQTEVDDPRVSVLGRLLRRTSIDELPQLFNVLRGEMSLVGPRPHVPGMLAGGMPYRELVPYYDLRLTMRPGITGWAQINGLRGPTQDAQKARNRIDHDLAYVQNVSLWLDIRIIARTLAREFVTGTGI